MTEGPLAEKAYGKINLGLKILGRRPDGYHDILSIAQGVDLADILHFEPAPSDQLTCNIEDLSTGPDNLVRRAVDSFRARLDHPIRHFRIHLEKHIPMGAGLGGGSADAAATLRALNRFYGEPLDRTELGAIAAELGSDIPFLVEGGTALMRGRGEILEPLGWAGAGFYVLAYPEVEALVGLVGPAVALEILYEARVFDAVEAKDKGLVNRVVPDEEVDAAVASTVEKICAGAPLVNRWHKKFVYKVAAGAELTAEDQAEGFACFDTQDFQEGVMAFMAKDKPDFKGN